MDKKVIIKIGNTLKRKITTQFKLTSKQQEVLIKEFINKNKTFNKKTPVFLLENKECIKNSLNKDVNTVNYIRNIPKELEEYIINEVLKHNYILSKNSSSVLKQNFLIAERSIELDLDSANYVAWDLLEEKEYIELINLVEKKGFIIGEETSQYLKNEPQIIIASLKKDRNNINYIPITGIGKKEVFEYLILNDFEVSKRLIKSRLLESFSNPEILRRSFEMISMFTHDNKLYKERILKIYSDLINSKPSIKTFNTIFEIFAEKDWEEYKKENNNLYDNVFGKICAELRNITKFKDIKKLGIIEEMEKVLGVRYATLEKSMKEYFDLYRSGTKNLTERIESSRDIISKISSTYISMSKENYKRDRLEKYNELIKKYYTLNLKHKIVDKKIIQVKKKIKLKQLYIENNKEIKNYVKDIIEKFSKGNDESTIKTLITNFICYNFSNIEDILDVDNYKNFKRYEKSIKLIHRLNSGYIDYNGPEVYSYKDIISYNTKTNEYYYSGIKFIDEEIKEYNNVKNYEKIFEQIKKEITFKTRTLEIDEITDYDLEELSKTLPFTDEYFVFNSEIALQDYTMQSIFDLYELGTEAELYCNDEIYNSIYNLLVNQGLGWLLIIQNDNNYSIFKDNYLEIDVMEEIISDMKNIIKISKDFSMDMSNFKNLLLLQKISKCAYSVSLAVLGEKVIENLYTNKEYTDEDESEIISKAEDLVYEMSKRNKSTVPYIEGETDNYKYSLYDQLDEEILLAGIYTDACFKVDGNDNDFLHYCALDKNGFVIKITDKENNFIARAGGFRNGNIVYINQLRTIYDECGGYYNSRYENERNEIIDTFKIACNDILNMSHNNKLEKDKIDFVFVTKSYTLKYLESNVSDKIIKKIGRTPIENNSEDWKWFKNSKFNLDEVPDKNEFSIDYDGYPLICIASKKKLKVNNINTKDVEALYERKRNKIIVTKTTNEFIERKINKIKGFEHFYKGTNFETIKNIPKNSTIFVGDNWFIIYTSKEKIISCLLEYDKKAKIEFEVTKQIINKYLIKEEYKDNIEKTSMDEYKKILKKI